jgi:hypothetical protein
VEVGVGVGVLVGVLVGIKGVVGDPTRVGLIKGEFKVPLGSEAELTACTGVGEMVTVPAASSLFFI